MAHGIDDFDDLLDEIEGSLQKKTPAPKGSGDRLPVSKSYYQVGGGKLSDVNDLLKSLDELEDNGVKNKAPTTNSGGRRASGAESRSLKCRHIVLAGPQQLPYGLCSVTEEKACDNLHCMKCDFQVLLFKGHHWVSSVNYMFFRNFMPDRVTLSKKLSKSSEHTAYCCQCSWINASTKKQLHQNDSFQWCCDSHSK